MLEAAKAVGQITHNHDEKRHPDHVVPNENNVKVTLAEAGIDRKLSSRAQKQKDFLPWWKYYVEPWLPLTG